jgi:hypothetical protein
MHCYIIFIHCTIFFAILLSFILCTILYLLKCSYIVYICTHSILFTMFHVWDWLCLFLTMFHVWTNCVFPSLCFHMWEFPLLLSHCVFTCELTVFCYGNFFCSCSLGFHMWILHWVTFEFTGFLCRCFFHYVYMWIRLVSHVKRLTVLKLH